MAEVASGQWQLLGRFSQQEINKSYVNNEGNQADQWRRGVKVKAYTVLDQRILCNSNNKKLYTIFVYVELTQFSHSIILADIAINELLINKFLSKCQK